MTFIWHKSKTDCLIRLHTWNSQNVNKCIVHNIVLAKSLEIKLKTPDLWTIHYRAETREEKKTYAAITHLHLKWFIFSFLLSSCSLSSTGLFSFESDTYQCADWDRRITKFPLLQKKHTKKTTTTTIYSKQIEQHKVRLISNLHADVI